jgi:hypothetical protein
VHAQGSGFGESKMQGSGGGQGQGQSSYKPYNTNQGQYQQGQYNRQQQQFQGAGSNQGYQQQNNNFTQPQQQQQQSQQQQPYMRQQGNRYPQGSQRETAGQYGTPYGGGTYQPPNRGAVLSGGGYYDPYAMAYAQDSNVVSTSDALGGQMMQLNLNQNHVPGMAQGGVSGPGAGQPAPNPTSAPQGENYPGSSQGYIATSLSMVDQYQQEESSQGV